MSQNRTIDSNDPKLKLVQKILSSKNDRTPFCLFPVRMETRFMTSERPVVENLHPFYDLLSHLIGLDEAMKAIQQQHTRVEDIFSFNTHLRTELDRLNQKIQACESLTTERYSVVVRHVDSIKNSIEQLSSLFSIFFIPSSEKRKMNFILDKEVGEKMLEILTTVEQIKMVSTGGRVNVKKLRVKSDQICSYTKALLKMPIDNRNKTKRGYYGKVEVMLDRIKKRVLDFEETLQRPLELSVIDDKQVNSDLDQAMVNLDEFDQKLDKVKSEYKRLEYQTRLRKQIYPIIKDIKEDFKNKHSLRTKLKNELKMLRMEEVIYHFTIAMEVLRMLNTRYGMSYHDLIYQWNKIEIHLKWLYNYAFYILTGSESEILYLRSLHTDFESELRLLVENMHRRSRLNSDQQESLKMKLHFQLEKFLSKLDKLGSDHSKEEPYISQKSFQEAATAFSSALKWMRIISQKTKALMDQHVTRADDIKYFCNTLKQYKDELNVAVKQIVIIPEQYYGYINKYYQDILFFHKEWKHQNAHALNNTSLLYDIAHLLEEISQSFSQLDNDITDEKSESYKDFRKRNLFAVNTRMQEELWIRVFPDQIMVKTHQKALTKEEEEDARRYWIEIWNASDDPDVEKAAWNLISSAYGPARAAYLLRKLNPNNVPQEQGKVKQSIATVIEKLQKAEGLLRKVIYKLKDFSPEEIHAQLIQPMASLQIYFPPTNGAKILISQLSYGKLNQVVHQLSDLLIRYHKIDVSIVGRVQGYKALFEASIAKFQMWTEKATSLMTQVEVVANNDIRLKRVVPLFPEDVEMTETDLGLSAYTDMLPENFVFVLQEQNGNRRYEVGNKIPSVLTLGINVQAKENAPFELDQHGNIITEDEVKWLFDFDEAVKQGMGIVIPLTPSEARSSYSKLMAIGVKDLDVQEGKARLEELFESHYFSPESMEVLPLGTPTNNTSDRKSAYQDEPDPQEFYQLENEGNKIEASDNELDKTDGQRLADALGLPLSFFQHLKHADQKSISNAFLINRIFWPVTMGNIMEESLDNVFTQDNIKRARTFFSNFVSGRGYLPSVRIGAQPYGFLPTTAFSTFMETATDELPTLGGSDFRAYEKRTVQAKFDTRFHIRLKDFLYELTQAFMEIEPSTAKCFHNAIHSDKNAQQHFMEILGLQPHSVDYFMRYGINAANRRKQDVKYGSNVNFKEGDDFSHHKLNERFGHLLEDGNFIDSLFYEKKEIDRLEQTKIYRMRCFEQELKLSDRIFNEDTKDLFAKDKDGNCYLDLLLDKKPYDLLRDSTYYFYHDPPIPKLFPDLYPYSLFFLLFRHAFALEYLDSTLNLLQKEGYINENTRRRAGKSITYNLAYVDNEKAKRYKDGEITYYNSNKIFTKWNYLMETKEDLNEIWQYSTLRSFPFAQSADSKFQHSLRLLNNSKDRMSNYMHRLVTSRNVNQEHKELVKNVLEFKDNAERLKGLSKEEIDRAFREHLDLCSYRLDAWQLGIANRRLFDHRDNSRYKGIYIGAFGYLERLKRGKTRTPATDVPYSLGGKHGNDIFHDGDNEGALLTPSLNHAITASILRSGYLANKNKGLSDNHTAINLSSRRIRKALQIIDGVHKGIDLAALMGYQFEKGLHERAQTTGQALDAYIYGLRKLFPAYAVHDESSQNNTVLQEEQNGQIVNGLLLIEAVKEEIGSPLTLDRMMAEEINIFSKLGVDMTISGAHRMAILKEIETVADHLDALSDLVLSESVYQMVQGNYVRAASVSNAIAKGQMPKEVQICTTPRSGNVLTQRAMLHMKPVRLRSAYTHNGNGDNCLYNEDLPRHWEHILPTYRTIAEPAINKWLGEMIGDPQLIRAFATYNLNGVEMHELICMDDLGIQAIDLVYLLNAEEQQAVDTLNSLVEYYLREHLQLDAEVTLHLNFKDRNDHLCKESEELTPSIKTFFEIQPLISSLYQLLSKSRMTDAEDYMIPADELMPDADTKQQDLHEFASRLKFLRDQLKNLKENTILFFSQAKVNILMEGFKLDDIQLDEQKFHKLKHLIVSYQNWQLIGSLSTEVYRGETSGTTKLLKELYDDFLHLDKVLTETEGADAIANDMPAGQLIENMEHAFKAILGKDFRSVCYFRLRNGSKLNEVLRLPHQEGICRNLKPFALDQWQQSVAKVRERMGHLNSIGILCDNFGIDAPEHLPVQLPFEEVELENGEKVKDYWLGSRFPEEYQAENDKLSLMIYQPKFVIDAKATTDCAALLVDEWVEIIPNKEETAAISFHYDQPDSEPAQAVLLAVCPEVDKNWKLEHLVDTVADTFDLTKVRSIEPDDLDRSMFAQVLPGIMGEAVPDRYIQDLKMDGQIRLQFSDTIEE